MRVIFPDKNENPGMLSRLVKKIPLFILFLTCLSPLISFVMRKIFKMPGILELCALSLRGINLQRYWQFFTYPFVASETLSLGKKASFEITQRFLIRNIVVYLLFSQALDFCVKKFGTLKCLFLMLIQILFTGTFVWALMRFFLSSEAFLGPECLLYTFGTIQTFVDPKKHVQIPIIPIAIPRKWFYMVLSILINIVLLIIRAYTVLAAIIFSTFISIIFCYIEKIPNPFKMEQF